MKRILVVSFLLATSSALAHEGKAHPPGDKHEAPKAAPPAAHGHAPGDHAHASPHGGIVATVDKETHVEVVFAEKAFGVYFYDADMRPVALPADAKATVVIGKDLKKLDLPIAKKPDGTPDDHLVGELAVAPDQKAAVVIQATVLGKARSARIEKPAAPAAPASAPAAAAAPKGTP
ncbi:MAG: hypothetical protein IT383_28020 [Deltaproteobacteria bacterium]|nr:hypothetical protein [Deltaproteobacteria bacterium]